MSPAAALRKDEHGQQQAAMSIMEAAVRALHSFIVEVEQGAAAASKGRAHAADNIHLEQMPSSFRSLQRLGTRIDESFSLLSEVWRQAAARSAPAALVPPPAAARCSQAALVCQPRSSSATKAWSPRSTPWPRAPRAKATRTLPRPKLCASVFKAPSSNGEDTGNPHHNLISRDAYI